MDQPVSRPPSARPKRTSIAPVWLDDKSPTSRSTGKLRAVNPDFSLIAPANRLTTQLLGLESAEQLVIVTDEASDDLSLCLECVALESGANVTRLHTDGPRASPDIVQALSTASAVIIVHASIDGDEGTRVFSKAARRARARLVRVLGVGRLALLSSLGSGFVRVPGLLKSVGELLRDVTRIDVRSARGTALEVRLLPEQRWMTLGEKLRSGERLDVPTGAMFTQPMQVDGTFIADGSMGGGAGPRLGRLAGTPVRLVIKGSRVVEVSGSTHDVVGALQQHFELGDGGRVSGVMLGLNLSATATLGEVMHDVTTPGLHLMLGGAVEGGASDRWVSGALPISMAHGDVDVVTREASVHSLIRGGRLIRFV